MLKNISDRYLIFHDNFVNLKSRLRAENVSKVDGILYDLGVFPPSARHRRAGFSYNQDAKLDMRMDASQSLSAYDVVNSWSYEDLKKIFYQYGEERLLRGWRRKLSLSVRKNQSRRLWSLRKLLRRRSLPSREERAACREGKVFQAPRIAVNRELEVFGRKPDRRAPFNEGEESPWLTFHSLEEAGFAKKRIFKSKTEIETPRGLPVRAEEMQDRIQARKQKTAHAERGRN